MNYMMLHYVDAVCLYADPIKCNFHHLYFNPLITAIGDNTWKTCHHCERVKIPIALPPPVGLLPVSCTSQTHQHAAPLSCI